MNPNLIRAITCLANIARDEKSDGFFWPAEFGHAPKTETTEGFREYRAPGGVLFLTPGKYRHYGYKNESAFAADCKKGQLHAKTVPGAITLGPLRIAPENEGKSEIHVFLPETIGRLTFNLSSQEEIDAVQKVLTEYLPFADIVVSSGAMAGLLAGVPAAKHLLPGLRAITRGDERWLFFLQVSIALSVVFVLAAGWATAIPYLYWSAILLTGVFLWVAHLAAKRTFEARIERR